MLYKGQVLISEACQPFCSCPESRKAAGPRWGQVRGPGFLASLAVLKGDQLDGQLRGMWFGGISTLYCLLSAWSKINWIYFLKTTIDHHVQSSMLESLEIQGVKSTWFLTSRSHQPIKMTHTSKYLWDHSVMSAKLWLQTCFMGERIISFSVNLRRLLERFKI